MKFPFRVLETDSGDCCPTMSARDSTEFTLNNGGCSCLVARLCPSTVLCQAPLSVEFSRQKYWSGVPLPSPGDLSEPGIKPGSPALEADALTSEPPGKPIKEVLKLPSFTDGKIS